MSRTVLRETQGEIPWVYSPKVTGVAEIKTHQVQAIRDATDPRWIEDDLLARIVIFGSVLRGFRNVNCTLWEVSIEYEQIIIQGFPYLRFYDSGSMSFPPCCLHPCCLLIRMQESDYHLQLHNVRKIVDVTNYSGSISHGC